MPVILPPKHEGDAAPPRPPNAIVWTLVFAVFMVGGVVIALLTWPKGEPVSTLKFCLRALVGPVVVFGIAFGLRLFYYEQELSRLQAEDEAHESDVEKAIEFASEPLAVMGCAYMTGMGAANLSSKFAARQTALEAQTTAGGAEGVRHTGLDSIEGETLAKRYRVCFDELIGMMRPTIKALPRDVIMDVVIHIPAGCKQEELLETWEDCWRQAALRRAKIAPLPAEKGLMALDEWLDIKGGRSLEKFALFVSVQLYDSPPEGGAEAAGAVLLGWHPLAARRGLDFTCVLHRPIEARVDRLPEDISKALLWGKADAASVKDLWQAGLDRDDGPLLLDAASASKLGLAEVSGFEGLHDIDTTLGHSGICAGWLAVALAAEYASQAGSPQGIAWREGSLRLAVVQPAIQTKEQVEATA